MYKFICYKILAIAIIFTSCQGKKAGFESLKRPNIIYILADDLGYGDVGYNGQNKFRTPNIDKLASEGMVFTQHYSGSTVCAPSRSALLTGQHTGHTPVRGNKEVQPEGQYPIPDSVYVLTEMLKDANYTTAVFGKWGLGYPGSEGDPNNQGIDEFYGYNCQRLAHHYYPYYLWHNQKKEILEGNIGKEQNNYAPHLIHEKALEFIKQNKDSEFFMFYASPLPHAELLLPQENIDEFKGKFLPEKIYNGTDEGDEYRKGPYGSQENSHAAFAAMVTLLDKQVGEIVSVLDSLGIADNTLIIFTSDNGPHQEGGADPDYFNSNGKYRGYKRDVYEGGIHVPMIAKWPGKIKPGSSTGHISAFWDVMPTIADVLDVSIDKNIDGISFLPTLLGNDNQKQHDYLYWEFHEKGGRIAIRKGKWKGVRYNVLENPNAPIELYDLSVDPGEVINIADEHPEITKELANLMKKARTDSEVFQFKASTYLNVK
ncbi:MAG: arylsulfatase [Bacteroidales bacterium]|nr:arylsulfatase [Bacteroidales bacterium]